MKKFGSVVRWIIGILVILGGLGSVAGSTLSGILLILAGLIMLPPISRVIPPFKGKTLVLVVGWIILFLAGVMFMPETEGSNSNDVLPAETPGGSFAELDKESAEELRSWINSAILDETMSSSDIEKWSQISEDDFLPIWKNVVLSYIETEEALIGSGDILSDIGQFDAIDKRLSHSIIVYISLYDDNELISTLRECGEELTQKIQESRDLQKKYPFDLTTASPSSSMFYVTQRLDKAYSDNILGALQKEFDSYQAQSTSDWVAYDVEYVMGTAFPGDSLYVIHADSLNPFSQSDAYELDYIDTGETTELVDSKGFTSTVPVYQLVEDTDAMIADQQAYSANWNQCFANLEKMKYLLGADGYADLQADAEQIAGDISGAYYEEGNASGIYINMTPDFSDPASAGSFHYLADGDGFGGAALYEVAANIYCARTIENDTCIFGFSTQGSEVVMDFYSDGEHSGTMKRGSASEASSAVATSVEPTVAQPVGNGGQYENYNLHIYEGSYSDIPESININLTVQPNETEFYCELFWIYGNMMEDGIVTPGVPTQLSEGTTITVDPETNGGIHVVLAGPDSDPFHYEYDLFQ